MDKIGKILGNIQNAINCYVEDNLVHQTRLLEVRKEYWNIATLNLHLQKELEESSIRLISLLEKNPLLHIIFDYPNYKNVLDDSVWVESLSFEQRKLLFQDELLCISQKELQKDICFYDDKIPFFSQILEVIYLNQFLLFLKKSCKNEIIQSSIKPVEKDSFRANLNDEQLEILVECCNVARIFSNSIDKEILSDIFNCTLTSSLIVKNNRLLAYFFSGLDDRSYITHQWQSIIDKFGLFLSSRKHKHLKQSDLSTANSEIKYSLPKGSEIIDKYLKELKKH